MIGTGSVLHASLLRQELVTRMRRARTPLMLSAFMATLSLVAIGFLLQQAGPGPDRSAQVGTGLFQVLAIVQLFLLLFATPASLASGISGERQRETWDLLLVTPISSFTIVVSKLIAGLAFDLLLIVSTLPLFSLAFLFGGVGLHDVIHVYLVFLATVVLLGTISVLASAYTRRVTVSLIVGTMAAVFLGIGLTVVALYFENWGQQATGPNGALPLPPLTPLAQFDPFVGVASALPAATGGSMLGGLDTVHHAFGLPIELHAWAAFCATAAVLSTLLIALTAAIIRRSH